MSTHIKGYTKENIPKYLYCYTVHISCVKKLARTCLNKKTILKYPIYENTIEYNVNVKDINMNIYKKVTYLVNIYNYVIKQSFFRNYNLSRLFYERFFS